MAPHAVADGWDMSTFDALFGANRRRLYGIAYCVLRNHAEAEDALQEALLKAWRSWPTLADTASANAWLTRICVNHCIDHRRRLFARRTEPSDPRHAAPEKLGLRGSLIDLDRAFETLSRRQRAVLTLHNHHGYSIDECGQLLNCSSGSIRTHIARAMTKLRREMTQ